MDGRLVRSDAGPVWRASGCQHLRRVMAWHCAGSRRWTAAFTLMKTRQTVVITRQCAGRMPAFDQLSEAQRNAATWIICSCGDACGVMLAGARGSGIHDHHSALCLLRIFAAGSTTWKVTLPSSRLGAP